MNRSATWMRASVLALAAVAAPQAKAEVVGNVGVFSEYLFRGVVGEGGAAVQGQIDWYEKHGFFLGTWASNANVVGGTELDLYGGWNHKFTDELSIDVGVLWYTFPEDKEDNALDFDGDGKGDDLDFVEWFTGVTWSIVKLQAYYSSDYAGLGGEDAWYLNGSVTIPLLDPAKKINVILQAGNTSGDGAEAYFGDEYWDYSITLTKEIREGLTFSLAAVDTDLHDNGVPPFIDTDDKPKVVVGVKQVFAF